MKIVSLAAFVGFLVGTLTTAANLPQERFWKTYRDKSGEGLGLFPDAASFIGRTCPVDDLREHDTFASLIITNKKSGPF